MADGGLLPQARATDKDEEHVGLLWIFQYVFGAVSALVALFPVTMQRNGSEGAEGKQGKRWNPTVRAVTELPLWREHPSRADRVASPRTEI